MRSMLAETEPGEETDTPHSNEIDDETSVRIIQQLAGVDVTGDPLDLPEAIVAYWRKKGRRSDGAMRENDLEWFVNDLTQGHETDRDPNDKAIGLIIDWYGIDTSSVLAVHYNPVSERDNASGEVLDSWIRWEAGSLKVIELGRGTFKRQQLRAAHAFEEIEKQLAVEASVRVVEPAEPILSSEDAQTAVAYNNDAFGDPLAIGAIQETLVGERSDGFSEDTVQRIAGLQQRAGVSRVSGMVDDDTMGVRINRLRASTSENAAIRISMDRYSLNDAANLLEIYYVPTLPKTAHAGGDELGPGHRPYRSRRFRFR